MKICTLSPQGNGVRNGGITRFSGVLESVGVENHFWELNTNSWNREMFDWEGEPFKLESQEDEDVLVSKLEKYDVILNNWPTLKDNEQESIRLYRVWKRLQNPTKITIVHNSMANVVFKENLSPLIYAQSDYIFTLNPFGATIPQEIIRRVPGAAEKMVNFRLFINLKDKLPMAQKFTYDLKEDYALWVGRFELCRDTGRIANVVNHINQLGHKSSLDYYAMGLENDTGSYWQFFHPHKEIARLSSYQVSHDTKPERQILTPEGRIDHELIKSYYEEDDSLNRLKVFGRYKHDEGMGILAAAKFGFNTYGPWNEKMVPTYSGGDKLENATIEIMTYALPVFDHRYLSLMDDKELFDSPFVFKNKHNATPEDDLELVKGMEALAADKMKYTEGREWSLDYIQRKHSVESFMDLVKSCHAKGKTKKATESEVLSSLYGRNVELTDDMWVSFHHTTKGDPYYVSFESKKEGSEEMKRVIRTRKKTTELF